MKCTTPHPDEVRKHFLDYAGYLDVLASDALVYRHHTAKGRQLQATRSELFKELAHEIRTIEFIEGPID